MFKRRLALAPDRPTSAGGLVQENLSRIHHAARVQRLFHGAHHGQSLGAVFLLLVEILFQFFIQRTAAKQP